MPGPGRDPRCPSARQASTSASTSASERPPQSRSMRPRACWPGRRSSGRSTIDPGVVVEVQVGRRVCVRREQGFHDVLRWSRAVRATASRPTRWVTASRMTAMGSRSGVPAAVTGSQVPAGSTAGGARGQGQQQRRGGQNGGRRGPAPGGEQQGDREDAAEQRPAGQRQHDLPRAGEPRTGRTAAGRPPAASAVPTASGGSSPATVTTVTSRTCRAYAGSLSNVSSPVSSLARRASRPAPPAPARRPAAGASAGGGVPPAPVCQSRITQPGLGCPDHQVRRPPAAGRWW